MKATLVLTALVSSLLLVQAEPASALLTVDADLVTGAGLMSDGSVTVIVVASGDVTVLNKPPTQICFPSSPEGECIEGQWTRIVNDGGTPVTTTVACSVLATNTECTQATLECGDNLIQHTVVGAIAGTNFFGSIDGIDVKAGKIAVACVNQQIPPPPATKTRR